MKHTFRYFVLFTFLGFLLLSFKADNLLTVKNLEKAYKEQITTAEKYVAFSNKAQKEGYTKVSNLFKALSEAKKVHASAVKKSLALLGVEKLNIKPDKFKVKTTQENIKEAIDFELKTAAEFTKIADQEEQTDAKRSFFWITTTEKKHSEFLKKALLSLANKDEENKLSSSWYVCTMCGNLYDLPSVAERCDFCMLKKNKFIFIQ